MNAYQAFIAAADFIEKNPDRYSFIPCAVPSRDSDEQGCMWGWAAHFYGIKAGRSYRDMAHKIIPDYDRTTFDNDPLFAMGKLGRGKKGHGYAGYTMHADVAARLMRDFANAKLRHFDAAPAADSAMDPAYLQWRTGFLAWARAWLSPRTAGGRA